MTPVLNRPLLAGLAAFKLIFHLLLANRYGYFRDEWYPWGMAEENNPIFVCRGLTPPLPELWPWLKKWN